MTDYFQILDFPRSVDLDVEQVRQRYHELAREAAPAEAAALNQAFEFLSQPVRRLKHLLDLLAPGQRPAVALSEDLMSLFGRVGESLARSKGYLERRSQVTSTLARALLAEEETVVQLELQKVLAEVTRAWEDAWEQGRDVGVEDVEELAALHGRLAFLDRWKAQLNECLLRFLVEE